MKRSKALPLRTAQSDGKRNADGEANDLGQQHQLDRNRQPLGHRLQHGLPGAERPSKIALQHVAEPAEIAPPDRLIEPHVMAQRRDFLRRRLIAQDHVSEIARQQRGDAGMSAAIQQSEPAPGTGAFARRMTSMRGYSIQTSDTSITPLYIFGRPLSFALEIA